jgi:hypothetical protein
VACNTVQFVHYCDKRLQLAQQLGDYKHAQALMQFMQQSIINQGDPYAIIIQKLIQTALVRNVVADDPANIPTRAQEALLDLADMYFVGMPVPRDGCRRPSIVPEFALDETINDMANGIQTDKGFYPNRLPVGGVLTEQAFDDGKTLLHNLYAKIFPKANRELKHFKDHAYFAGLDGTRIKHATVPFTFQLLRERTQANYNKAFGVFKWIECPEGEGNIQLEDGRTGVVVLGCDKKADGSIHFDMAERVDLTEVTIKEEGDEDDDEAVVVHVAYNEGHILGDAGVGEPVKPVKPVSAGAGAGGSNQLTRSFKRLGLKSARPLLPSQLAEVIEAAYA